MQRTSVWAYTGAARYLPGMLKVIRKTFKNQFEVQVEVVPGKRGCMQDLKPPTSEDPTLELAANAREDRMRFSMGKTHKIT